MDVEVLESPAPHRRSRRVAALAAATVLALGAGGVAFAASNSSGTPSPSPSGSAPQGAPPAEGFRGGPGQMGDHGRFGVGGLGFALHGEYVTQKSDGSYETVDVQQGTVSEVSSSSITVKSADGFSKTYQVGQDTLVGAQRDGISTVKKDDTVHLTATVSDGKATAVQIVDMSQEQSTFKRWRNFGPRGQAPGTPPGGTATPSPSGSNA